MRLIQKGSVDRSVDLYIIDSTDGTPEVGVLFNTAGIDLKYRRDLSAAVSITEATLAALTTAHADGGFLEIGNGVYRLDLPDAAWAAGADHVTIFGTVTGMIVLPVTVQLVAYDPESALATPTNITAATGVVLSGVTHTGAVIPTVTTLTGHTAQTGDSFARIGATGSGLTSLASQASVNTIDDFLDTEVAAILAAVDTEVGDIKTKTDFLPSATAGASGGLFIAGTNAATTITTALTTTFTGNLTGSVASVTGAVASVTAGVTLAASAVQAIWDALTSALTTVGSVGKLLVDNINATISSRSTYAGGAVASVTADVGITQAAADKVFGSGGAAMAELAQGIPAATPSPGSAIMALYMALRNKLDVTATTKSVTNDAGTVIFKKALSDDGTTYSEAEAVSGP